MYMNKGTLKQFVRLATSPERMHPQRTSVLLTFSPIYAAVHGADRVARWLDEKLFPEYRETDVGEPIFIMASPRSGTTLLHRLMSLDQQFTSYSLWQTILPAISAYKVVDGIKRVDELVGRPMDRLQDAAARYFFRGWEGKHRTRFNEAEEDEASFFLQMATPAVWLAQPWVNDMYQLAYVDRLPIREQLADFVRTTMQRHLWHAHQQGEQKTLLLKNVLIAGRLGVYTDAAPNSRFIHIVRNPYNTVGSLMSLFTTPWKYHSPDVPMDGSEARAFAETAMDYALTMHRFMKELPPERGITIMYDDLVADAETEILKIYEHFGLEASEDYRQILHEVLSEERTYESSHEYTLEEYGLSRELVYERLQEIFDDFNLPR